MELDGVGCARVRTHPGLEVETPGPEQPEETEDRLPGSWSPAWGGGVSPGRPGTFPWGCNQRCNQEEADFAERGWRGGGGVVLRTSDSWKAMLQGIVQETRAPGGHGRPEALSLSEMLTRLILRG